MSTIHAVFVVFLASALSCAGGESVAERAEALARRGEIDPSIELLRKHLEGTPGDVQARMLLGHILIYDGRPDEAEKNWRAGLTDKETDLPLLLALGRLLSKQGEEGPTVSYKRGSVCPSRARRSKRDWAIRR